MQKTPTKMAHVDIGLLIPYINNARKHSEEQIKKIQSSIREFGFLNPVMIDGNHNVIAGHGRIEAARREGMTEIPCVFVEHLSDAQRKAYIIADNRLAEDAGWDELILKNELQALAEMGFDTDLTGFFLEDFVDEDDPRDEREPSDEELAAMVTMVNPGEVWALGAHRLMCGDSTKPEDFEKLMADTKAALVITEPPYNVNYGDKAEMLEEYLDGKGHRITSKILNDNMGDQEFRQFLTDAFTRANEAMVPGAPIYVFHAETEGINFREAFKAAGLKLSQCLIWVKSAFVLGRQDYHWRHEPILYGWKEGEAHPWYGGRKKDTAILEECPGVTVKQTKKGDLITFTDGFTTVSIRAKEYEIEDTNTVIYHERPTRNDDHPTMKPIGLIVKLLRNSSKRGDVVLDPFGGSGSTLLACEEQKRTCYTMELAPEYCDVIIRRWEAVTGGKAERVRV
jgi:DNA modification methylase